MDQPSAVAVVIPAFNEEGNLRKCLESLLAQEGCSLPLEIVVVDNGSTDRTRDVAAEFGALVLSDPSLNVSGLRNMGVARTSANIIAFVDADCVVAPDWFGSAAKYFDVKDAVAWGAPPTPPENPTWVQEAWCLVRRSKHRIADAEWLESMNLWVRRSAFEEVGGFKEELITCEDVDFGYRIRKLGRIVSDDSIRVTHWGEAATVRQFARKEFWRGRSNWSAIRSHGLRASEIPSLLIPINFGFLVPMSLLGLFWLRAGLWLALTALFLLTPTAVALFKLRGKGGQPNCVLKLLVLLQVYFFCRTCAVFSRSRR